MLVSVIIPVYNVEKYLSCCIDSVINQTYANIEIILVNDGSTDGSGQICEVYAQKDSRIKVFHKKNGGLSDARNYGMKQATGEYFTFVDSDDKIAQNGIEILVKTLNKYHVKLVMATFSYLDNNQLIKSNSANFFEEILSVADYLDYLYTHKTVDVATYITAWGKLYHRDLFADILFPVSKLHEDEFTTYKLAIKSEKIAYVNEFIYHYRKREGSIMESEYRIAYLDALEALKERVAYLENLGYNTDRTVYYLLHTYSYHKMMLKKYQFDEMYQKISKEYNLLFKKVYPELSIKQKLKESFIYYFPRLVFMIKNIKKI